jgi:hypothetical protein
MTSKSMIGFLTLVCLSAGCFKKSPTSKSVVDACAGAPTLSNGQSASVVVGQADFTSGADNPSGSVTANSLAQGFGASLVYGGKYFITDYGNSRILGFDSVPTQNQASASFVIGQSSLTLGSNGVGPDRLSFPMNIGISNGKLVVLDSGNARILIFNTVPSATGAQADVVLGGASSFNASGGGGCNSREFAWSDGMVVAGGKIILADNNHSRVLIWNSIPTTNNAPADLVLGQPDFDTCVDPWDGSTPPTTRDRFWGSAGVASDGTRLAVSDSRNSRVLIWNQFPTTINAPADLVLGQSSFTSGLANAGGPVSSSSLNSPSGLYIHQDRLYVVDAGNYRVLVWNPFPTSNQAPADRVLGQSDFTSNSVGTLAADKIISPAQVYVCKNQVFLTDGVRDGSYSGGARTLIFNGQ